MVEKNILSREQSGHQSCILELVFMSGMDIEKYTYIISIWGLEMKVVLPDNSIKKLAGVPVSEKNDRRGTGSFLKILENYAAASNQKGSIPEALPLDREKLHFIAELLKLQMHRNLISSFLMNPGEGDWPDRTSNIQFAYPKTGQDSGEKKQTAPGVLNPGPSGLGPVGFSSAPLEGIIQRASETYGVEPGLIKAVIKTESGFNPNAVSPKGARGLMQLMPATARDLGVRNAFDPEENIMGGTRYLKGLLDRYDGNLNLALGAYNWGMGNVERSPEKFPRETLNYIARVSKSFRG